MDRDASYTTRGRGWPSLGLKIIVNFKKKIFSFPEIFYNKYVCILNIFVGNVQLKVVCGNIYSSRGEAGEDGG